MPESALWWAGELAFEALFGLVWLAVLIAALWLFVRLAARHRAHDGPPTPTAWQ